MPTGHYNEARLRPLTEHSRGVLADLAKRPKPCHEVNNGVQLRLLREKLVEVVQLLGYSAKNKSLPCLRITDAGRRVLESGS